METKRSHYLVLTAFLVFISCSTDNEISESVPTDAQERSLPMGPLSDVGTLESNGFSQRIRKYENGVEHYRAQYYYRTDGNLQIVEYSYPHSSSQIYTDTYHYDTEGKLIKLDGHDVYNFHWDKNRIVEADKYNAMWYGRSKILYKYNKEGQLIQRTENNLDFGFSEKIIYSYFQDGNLKTIEQYGNYNESGEWNLYFITIFEGYKDDRNLFLELEIIPGQIAQHQFPSAMSYKHLTAPDYDLYETYQYKYDTEGRVVEKIYDNNKVIYEYY